MEINAGINISGPKIMRQKVKVYMLDKTYLDSYERRITNDASLNTLVITISI